MKIKKALRILPFGRKKNRENHLGIAHGGKEDLGGT